MSPILFFIIFFTCTGVGKIFLQINSAAVAFIDILIAAWEGLSVISNSLNRQKNNYFLGFELLEGLHIIDIKLKD